MALQLIDEIETFTEQRLTLPGFYGWEQFLALEAVLTETPGLRLTYLDGSIELMTFGETHESLKSMIRFLLEVYLVEKGLKFFPVGSTTQRDQTQDVSFEPDESYYLGNKKSHPDLALEVIITSGNLKKLEKYRRFKITEVWFWQNNQLSVYHWREPGYELVKNSELFPDLDLELFARCVQMSDILEARNEFLQGMRS